MVYDDVKQAVGFAPQPSRTTKNVTTNDPKLDAMSGSTLSSLWELWERVPAASASRRKEEGLEVSFRKGELRGRPKAPHWCPLTTKHSSL